MSPDKVYITHVNTVLVHCNIAQGSYSVDADGTLSSRTVLGYFPGYKINIEPWQLFYLPVNTPLMEDTFSCGPINMKFVPHEICSISIPKPTDWRDFTVKVMWAELRKLWKWTAIWWKWLAETVKKVTGLLYPNFHHIPFTQFPHRLIQKTVISPYWGRDCCSSGIWKPIEKIVCPKTTALMIEW